MEMAGKKKRCSGNVSYALEFSQWLWSKQEKENIHSEMEGRRKHTSNNQITESTAKGQLSYARRRITRKSTHQSRRQWYASTSSIDDSDSDSESITRKKASKATILSWLIDINIIQENAQVFCGKKNKGKIKRGGILCPCCDNVFTVEAFHIHCGRNCEKPYRNIFVEQKSLLDCMIDGLNKPDESKRHKFNKLGAKRHTSVDLYDDACMICADGGQLMCCEKCYSTYHQECIGLEEIPKGCWYCPYCVCKFCGDPAEENDNLIQCPQCEKKYHWDCQRSKKCDLNCTPIAPFCTESCKEVHNKLSNVLVGKKNELNDGYCWMLLHLTDNEGILDDVPKVYVEDDYLRTLCNSKLAVARRLMEDSFEPIRDRHTGIKLIPSVLYNRGSNLNRINFRGFYTAVLEKEDEIISVASLRVHGSKLAEMPFISTSEVYRCQGMCKKLMDAIESALRYLNVEYLVIPSTEERLEKWIDKYGFRNLEESMKLEVMGQNTLMFHDSVRLQKPLLSSSKRKQASRFGLANWAWAWGSKVNRFKS